MYRTLRLDEIEANPDQPRKRFDETALAELAASIKANGLLEPVIVRPHDDGFMLIAGERRWRAAFKAGLEEIPARILYVDEQTAFELSVAENVNRHDMNPIEEAQAFQTLRGFGRDNAQIAYLFGKTTVYVKRRLELLDLSPEFTAHVESGTIAISVAQQVARLNPANQQAMLFKLMKGAFANDNEALHFAYALGQAESQTSMFDLEEPTDEVREARSKTRKQVMSWLQKAEALADVLGKLADADPGMFADAFQGDGAVHVERLENLGKQISAAKFNARQGAAIANARDDLSGRRVG